MIPEKVNTLKATDSHFPGTLRQVQPPVTKLYWQGTNPSRWLDKPKVAVVGSRKVSAYGQLVTQQIVERLTDSGVVVISGLAMGVDSIAHQTALSSYGVTVAVLPTALDNIYPPSNLNLATRIVASGGSLISEYSFGSPTYKHNFIVRNRIVCGLADALVITEAAINSGTMHTARFALEAGITVMSVPGNITYQGSEGTNNLIKSGAIPVTDAGDILFALGISPSKATSSRVLAGFGKKQQNIYKLIRGGQSDQDDLAKAAKLSGSQLVSILTELEIAGAIRPTGGGQWVAL